MSVRSAHLYSSSKHVPPNAVLSQVIVPIAGPSDRLRVADVAVWYGARSGGIRTYLDAKARIAGDTGLFEGVPVIPLRYGVHAAFRPRSGCKRGEHVLYVGRLSPEKGLELLFDAMAASTGDWPLHLIGDGPAEPTLRRRAERLGLERRVIWLPFVHEPGALARAYAEAACVVVPGSHETFGLIALEAAASGAAVVASSAVPSASFVPGLVDLFPAGDASALAATIARAVASKPDPVAAMRLSKRSSWRTAIEAEIADLGTLRR